RLPPPGRACYRASPPLVVACALAGTVDIDMVHDPLGTDRNGLPVYLRDIWPTSVEIGQALATAFGPDLFRAQYVEVFEGDAHWRALRVPEERNLFEWDRASTYVREPPFFDCLTREPAPIDDIVGGR